MAKGEEMMETKIKDWIKENLSFSDLCVVCESTSADPPELFELLLERLIRDVEPDVILEAIEDSGYDIDDLKEEK